MYKIAVKRKLVESIYLMEIEAPRVAKAAKPGQFVILKLDERGERVPLTICDYDRAKGRVTIVFQTLGRSTKRLAALSEGESIRDFVGPLGNPSEVVESTPETLSGKRILFVAGGVGTAPVYPQVKALHEKGVAVDVLIGTRSKETLIFEEEFRHIAGNLYITTEDGSYGDQGRVTDKLLALSQAGVRYDLCVAIGPMVMMKFVSLLTKELGIPTVVSLNPIMVDGTGMCGACRVTVGEEVKFACVDGPEFDGHRIDFDEAMRRQDMYRSREGKKVILEESREAHRKGDLCALGEVEDET